MTSARSSVSPAAASRSPRTSFRNPPRAGLYQLHSPLLQPPQFPQPSWNQRDSGPPSGSGSRLRKHSGSATVPTTPTASILARGCFASPLSSCRRRSSCHVLLEPVLCVHYLLFDARSLAFGPPQLWTSILTEHDKRSEVCHLE